MGGALAQEQEEGLGMSAPPLTPFFKPQLLVSEVGRQRVQLRLGWAARIQERREGVKGCCDWLPIASLPLAAGLTADLA